MSLIIYSVYTIYALAGLLATINIAIKPKLFWPILLVASVVGGGLMIQGYGLIDEYLLGMALLGGLIALFRGKISFKQTTKTIWQKVHYYLFMIFIGYMLCQSVRGLIVLNDLRITRWIIYYLLLGLLAWLLFKKALNWPSPQKITLIIAVAGLVYFSAYLLTGYFYEAFSHGSRYDLQGYLWAGTAAAMLPLTIVLASVISLLKNYSPPKHILGWVIILISTLASYYYGSRVGILIILSFIVLALILLKFKQFIFFLLIFLIITGFFKFGGSLLGFSRIIVQSATLHSPSDSGRLMHLQAGIDAIRQKPKTALFGFSVHTNRLIIGPYLQKLGYFQGGPTPPIIHTTGLGALFIDTGFIGVFLFYANLIVVGCRVLFAKRNPNRLTFLLIIGMFALWPLISDVQDVILLYLLIIPAGIFNYLSQPIKTPTDPTRPIKLCFLASADSIHSVKWISYFCQKNYQVSWISLTPLTAGEINNIKFYRVPGLGKIAPINLLFDTIRLRRLLQEIKPDILHAHYAGANGILAALSGFHPLILTVWGSDILINTKSKIKGPFIKFALRQADLITCDAQHMVGTLNQLGITSDKIKQINFGVDTQKFQPQKQPGSIRKQLNLASRPLIISLRQLEPIYDVSSLIKAIAIVSRKTPDIACLIIGQGSENKSLRALTQSLDIQDKIIFVGHLPNDQLPKYLAAADIYVSTALSDAGISASTAEAMACGVPVIVTDTGENKKWIHSGHNGFIIPAQNPKALAAKIIWLLQNPRTRQSFGQRGRQTIQQKNDYYQEMAKMEKIYQIYARATK